MTVASRTRGDPSQGVVPIRAFRLADGVESGCCESICENSLSCNGTMEEPSVQQTLRSHGLFSTSSYEARPMAELRALASDFDVPHDLATSWQALGMRLALDEAVTIARAANPEQVLRLMGAHDVCVRASWLCRQDRLSLWGLRGKLPPEAIVSVEDLFHVHKRFGTETLPLVAMREMFVSGEEEELAGRSHRGRGARPRLSQP